MSTKTRIMPDIEVAQLVDRFMRHIHANLTLKAPTFDTEKVGPAGGMVLMTIGDQEPVAIHELVRSIARDKAQVTRLLHVLGDKGLLEKSQCPTDGRVCVLQLTSKGRDTVKSLRFALAETIDGVLDPLNKQERDTLKTLLKKAFDPS